MQRKLTLILLGASLALTAKAATIRQTIQFKGVSAQALYEVYTDAAKHSAATRSNVIFENRIDGAFSLNDLPRGELQGKNLLLVPGKLIVQSWRGSHFAASDPDATLVLSFEDSADGGTLSLVQTHLPDGLGQEVEGGWKQVYWTQWGQYLNSPANVQSRIDAN